MKRVKKTVSVLLAAFICFAAAQLGTLLSSADTFLEEGDFRFAIVSDNNIFVAGYNGSSTSVILPETCGGKPVRGVYSRCFENTSIESVTITEGYKTISAFAFSGCQSLTEVILPSTLETIGIMAFNGCTGLQEIHFNEAASLESIGFAAFNNCTSLNEVLLPDSVAAIGENAFCGCASMHTLRLSENLSVIPEYAFYGCAALGTVKFSASVEIIGESAFENAGLSEVYIPETVSSIGENAFAPDIPIVCFDNTYAAEYCRTNNMENVWILQRLIGDANLDGTVNINDVTEIQRYLAEYAAFAEYQIILADIDASGTVTVSDATGIQNLLAEYV